MKISSFVVRMMASCLSVLLAIQFGATAARAQEQSTPSGQAAAPQPAQSVSSPDSRSNGSPAPDSESGAQNAQSRDVQNNPEPQTGAAKPVGTAVAPYEKTTGVTASRPAGAVIAPAKQRRVRAILIRVGVIAGAGVAVGTVIALSHASPSQPH